MKEKTNVKSKTAKNGFLEHMHTNVKQAYAFNPSC
jgi:hypothetical protein